jgi:hypothetical protein
MSVVASILSIVALCRVALWLGFKSAGQVRAIVSTVLLVKGIPYLLSLSWSMITQLLGVVLVGSGLFYFGSLLPPLATIAFYLWIIRVARNAVSDECRASSAKSLLERLAFR